MRLDRDALIRLERGEGTAEEMAALERALDETENLAKFVAELPDRDPGITWQATLDTALEDSREVAELLSAAPETVPDLTWDGIVASALDSKEQRDVAAIVAAPADVSPNIDWQTTLDRALESPESLQVAEAVAGRPEEAPSLTWRSRLNERLLALRPGARPKLRWWHGASLATATGLFAWLMLMPANDAPPAPSSEGSDSFESLLVAAHSESVSAGEAGFALEAVQEIEEPR